MSTSDANDGRRFLVHVVAAFGGQSSPLSEELLRELRSFWQTVSERSRRLVFVMVILIALFILVRGAGVAEIAFVGVKLAPSAIELISIAIPAVVAYLSAECWGLIGLSNRYQELHDEICAQLHPNLGPLRMALHPPDTFSLGGYLLLAMGGGSGMGELPTVLTTAATQFVIFYGPLLFLGISYGVLISDLGIDRLALLVSLAFSLFYAIRTIGFRRIGALRSNAAESDA